MAEYQKSENALIAATGTAKYATFATGVRRVYIVSDADCFISFDENVATTGSFLIKANQHPADFEFDDGGPNKVWAITSGGAANVYILVLR